MAAADPHAVRDRDPHPRDDAGGVADGADVLAAMNVLFLAVPYALVAGIAVAYSTFALAVAVRRYARRRCSTRCS